MPILSGETDAVRPRLFGEHSGAYANQFLVDGRHKYIWFPNSNEEQLFNLQDDPYECHDLSENAELLIPLREMMADHLREREDYRYEVAQLRPLANQAPAFYEQDLSQL